MTDGSGMATFGPDCAAPMGAAIDLVLAFIDGADELQALEVLNSADPCHVTAHLTALVNAIGQLICAGGGEMPGVQFQDPGPAMMRGVDAAMRFLGDPKSIRRASDDDVRDGAVVLTYVAVTLTERWTGQARPRQFLRSLRACCHDAVAMNRVIQQSGRCN